MSQAPQVIQRNGIGLCGALFLLFVALRLTDHIDWAWYWVAAPLWWPLGLVAIVVALFGVAFGLLAVVSWPGDAIKRYRRRKQREVYHATGKWR